MVKKSNVNKMKIVLGIILLSCAIILSIMNAKTQKGVKVMRWENYYNENNIVFFYGNSLNEDLKILDSTYKVNELVNKETSEIDKVLKTVDILNSIVEYDDVKETEFNSGYEILLDKAESKKVSQKDMAIIERDLLTIIGFNARTGIFRKDNAQFAKNPEYYVAEYWSTKYNKWIMIDFLDKGYFLEGDNKLSSVEVLTKDIRKISYLGKSSQKDYKSKIKEYLNTYSLPIDNTTFVTKSNSYVTYVKDKNSIELKLKNKFLPPTIFTEELRLFEKSPFDKQVGSDERAYIILAKSSSKSEKSSDTPKDKSSVKLVIGGFRDDKIMDTYYLNINDSGYEQINKYKEIELSEGVTKIELSLDGTNTVSSVVINKGK